MSDKLFYRILTVLCVLGVIATVALVYYTYQLHGSCSILSFIANERG